MSDEPTHAIGIENGSAIAWSAPERFRSDLADLSRTAQHHLYMVVVGPKLVPTGLSLSPSTRKYRLDVSYKAKNERLKTRTIMVPPAAFPDHTLTFDDDLRVLSLMPHSGVGKLEKITVAEVVRATIGEVKDNQAWIDSIVDQFFTFDVKYIGQSYGKNGSSGAIDRLTRGHETVDKILSDTMSYSHDQEVAFITLDQQMTNTDMVFNTGQDSTRVRAMMAGMFAVNDAGTTTKLIVDAAEASLITAFDPEWNEKLTDFTQKDAPKMLADLKAFHATHLRIRIDLRKSNAKLRGPKRGVPSPFHSWAFNLSTGAIEYPSEAPLQWRITDY